MRYKHFININRHPSCVAHFRKMTVWVPHIHISLYSAGYMLYPLTSPVISPISMNLIIVHITQYTLSSGLVLHTCKKFQGSASLLGKYLLWMNFTESTQLFGNHAGAWGYTSSFNNGAMGQGRCQVPGISQAVQYANPATTEGTRWEEHSDKCDIIKAHYMEMKSFHLSKDKPEFCLPPLLHLLPPPYPAIDAATWSGWCLQRPAKRPPIIQTLHQARRLVYAFDLYQKIVCTFHIVLVT